MASDEREECLTRAASLQSEERRKDGQKMLKM